MESTDAANPLKTYGVLKDINLDENHDETEPSRQTIDTKGKKRVADGRSKGCLIASKKIADFMRLDELPLHVKPNPWDASDPKIKLESNDLAAPKSSQDHENRSQAHENPSKDPKNEKPDSAVDTKDSELCI